jgi:hypothetical protein
MIHAVDSVSEQQPKCSVIVSLGSADLNEWPMKFGFTHN